MTTHGGTWQLTASGLDYIPAPKPVINPRTLPTITIHPWLNVARAMANPPHDTIPVRKRRKSRPAPLKRRSSATAIGSTRSWTGITEWAMIPATKEMQAVFDAERALRRLDRKANPELARLERALGLNQ